MKTSNNVVIFGPAHVGKSTLVGYLMVKSGGIDDFHKKLGKFKKELGDSFDKSQKFAYLVDTGVGERRSNHHGTSQYMHTARVNFQKLGYNEEEWVLIDTPGAQHNERERIKGIYYGDVGIFMIEAPKLLKDLLDDVTMLEEFFAPLLAWNQFGKSRQLVVVISKMDEVNYSTESFIKAERTIQRILRDKENRVPIIPIAINVESEVEHNIIDSSKGKLSWYSGDTLIITVEKLLASIPYETSTGSLMAVDKVFGIRGQEMVVRGKVLKGHFGEGERVRLSPVLLKNVEIGVVEATIREIVEEKGEEVEVAQEGRLIGISFGKLADKDVTILKTTTITPKNTVICMGSILTFDIAGDYLFKLYEYVDILWFGKIISGEIISIPKSDSCLNAIMTIMVELKNVDVSLPRSNQENYEYQNFFLRKKNSFIKGNLKDISEKGEIWYDKKELSNIFACREKLGKLKEKARIYPDQDKVRLVILPKVSMVDIMRFIERISGGCQEKEGEIVPKNILLKKGREFGG